MLYVTCKISTVGSGLSYTANCIYYCKERSIVLILVTRVNRESNSFIVYCDVRPFGWQFSHHSFDSNNNPS